MQRMPAEHYTRERVERMICWPNVEFDHPEVFKKKMASAVMGAKPTAGNHDQVLSRIANARRAVAKKAKDERVLDLMSMSPHYSKNAAYHPKVAISVFDWDYPYKGLHALAEKRLPQSRRAKKGPMGNVIDHRVHVLPGGRKIKTNIIIRNAIRLNQVQIGHIYPEDHPAVMSHLKRVWKRAHAAKTPRGKLSAAAEYEWWFYQMNPTNRGGASIGDCMSAVLRKSVGLPLEEYKHRDWHALTLSLKKYVKMRVRSGREAARPTAPP